MNTVILIGRLTKDPELRRSTNSCFAMFTLAVNRDYKQEGQPEADFINCQAWGKTAENLCTYQRKGNQIGIEGRLRVESYQKDGSTQYLTKVVADRIQFLDKKSSNSDQNGYNQNGYQDNFNSQNYQQPYQQQGYSGQQQPQNTYYQQQPPQPQALQQQPQPNYGYRQTNAGAYPDKNVPAGYVQQNMSFVNAYDQQGSQNNSANYSQNKGPVSNSYNSQRLDDADISRDDLPF